ALPYDKGKPVIKSAPGWEYAQCGGRTVFLKNLYGWDETRPAQGWGGTRRGNNLLGACSVTPLLRTKKQFTGVRVLVSVAAAMPARVSPRALNKLVKAVEVEDDLVVITFGDGEKALVQIDEVKNVSAELNGKMVRGPVRFARVSADGKQSFVLRERRPLVKVKPDRVKPVGGQLRAVRERDERVVDGVLSRMTLEEKVGACITHSWRGALITPSVVETIERLHASAFRIEPFTTEAARPLSGGKDFVRPLRYFKVAETHFR
ncbi:unnamed protein product, partial [marine sediment metagenome]